MKRYIIPSLLAVGFGTHQTSATSLLPSLGSKDDGNPSLLEKLRLNHLFTLARHHSHVSHSSHVSHRSSTGGYSAPLYAPPAPSYQAPAPLLTPDSLPSLKGNTAKFASIVRLVQQGLTAYGYYDGPIDGVVGPKAKFALTQFQTDFNLKVTGTITPEVLDALGIAAR